MAGARRVRLLLDFQRLARCAHRRLKKTIAHRRSSWMRPARWCPRNERSPTSGCTRRDGGDPIVFFRARDDRAEARYVAETILRMQAEGASFETSRDLSHQRAVAGGLRKRSDAHCRFRCSVACAFSSGPDQGRAGLSAAVSKPRRRAGAATGHQCSSARQIGQTTRTSCWRRRRQVNFRWQVVVTTARGGAADQKKQKDLLGTGRAH